MSAFDQRRLYFSLFWFLPWLAFPTHEAYTKTYKEALYVKCLIILSRPYGRRKVERKTYWPIYTQTHTKAHTHTSNRLYVPDLANFALQCLLKVWDLFGKITKDPHMFYIWDWFTPRPFHLAMSYLSLFTLKKILNSSLFWTISLNPLQLIWCPTILVLISSFTFLTTYSPGWMDRGWGMRNDRA